MPVSTSEYGLPDFIMKRERPQHVIWLMVIGMFVICVCASAQAQQQPSSISIEPEVRAAYGVVPGHRDFNSNSPDHFVREDGYPPGMFAVSIPDRTQLLAFDANSNAAAVCVRIEPTPVKVPNDGGRYFRFRCPGTWDSREVVFLDTESVPTSGEELKWTALAGPSPLSVSRTSTPGDLHDHAAIARPSLLNGQYLTSAAWFAGEYLPKKEYDDLRGDSIAFGHYTLLDRILFIGETPQMPSKVLYESKEPVDVREGIEWAFLPQNASEKTQAAISALYEIPNGYLVRVSMHHDHEGFGVDESSWFYAFEAGRWRLRAKAEFTRLY